MADDDGVLSLDALREERAADKLGGITHLEMLELAGAALRAHTHLLALPAGRCPHRCEVRVGGFVVRPSCPDHGVIVRAGAAAEVYGTPVDLDAPPAEPPANVTPLRPELPEEGPR